MAVIKQRSGHSECKNIFKAPKTTLKQAYEDEDTGKGPLYTTMIVLSYRFGPENAQTQKRSDSEHICSSINPEIV